MIKKQFNIIKNTGFARPATLLVKLSQRFTSDISLEYQGKTINLKHSAKSIMDIMSLSIRPGTKFYIKAEGIDEVQAIQLIQDYLYKEKLINY
ncbi:HPr family phosphocarrier protein [Halalkalibacter alkalisediminis]|uniref:HPr family phosphocarrier protein n=1 Tax=Halalkalibacter alkalisediminis TaxID=935616 RepID=A0ABV6NJD7_9BACI|nr:HPr family phosphocarrier protein [Halalkalibacter alkalisediminis]